MRLPFLRRVQSGQTLLPWALGLGLVMLAGVGCNGPCESLAERICSCEPNNLEEQGCIEEVRITMGLYSPTPAELDACSAALDTCDCEALEREDLAACGLSKGGG